MLKVYLGGPMTGLTVKEASHWRTDLMDRFVPGTIKWLNPVDQVDLDWNQTITTDYAGASEEVDNDIEMIKKADIVVFNMCNDEDPTACSVGSCIEMGIAYALGKEVIVVNNLGDKYNHPFVHKIAGDDVRHVYTSPVTSLYHLLNESIAVKQSRDVGEHHTDCSNHTKRNVRVNINTEWCSQVNYQ